MESQFLLKTGSVLSFYNNQNQLAVNDSLFAIKSSLPIL